MLEYGLNLLFSFFFFSRSLSGVPSLSRLPRLPSTSYAWNGFLNTDLPFCESVLAGFASGVTFRLFGAG